MTETTGGAPHIARDAGVEATQRLIEAVVEADSRMRRRLDFVSEAIFEVDGLGALVYVNRAWTTLTGRPESGSHGRLVWDEFAEDYRGAVREVVAGSAARVTVPLLREDGSRVWVRLSATPMLDGGAIGALDDISDEIATRDELAMLSAVARSTDSPVMITDSGGRIDWVNPAFELRTGYTLAEVRGRRPGAVLQGPETDPRAVARLRTAIRGGRSISEELINYTKSGEPYWALLQITPVTDDEGAVTRFVGLQSETTERRRYEQQILDHTSELEARVVARTADLAKAKDAAESAVQAQGAFLAMMSHEIRTSLNAIVGLSRLCLGTDLDARQRDYVVKTDRAAQNLVRIVNDVLDFSKIEADALELEFRPVDLRAVLANVDAVVGSLARDKGLEFVVDDAVADPTGLVGDPFRLEQVLLNLGGNAVKFTASGQVRIGARTTSVTDEQVTLEFRVTDTGIGLQPDELDRMFDAFAQAESSTSRRFGGTGLGLTISKRLIERMGGEIAVTSAPGEGTTFVVTVPLARAGSSDGDPGADADLDVRSDRHLGRLVGARILVAEDDPFAEQIIRETLAAAGAHVTIARRGQDVLDRVDHDDVFDIVLMDVQLPDMDGLEVTRRLRADAMAAGLIVIAMTAGTGIGDRDACRGAGMDDFESKPVVPERLFATLARWLPDRDVSAADEAPRSVDPVPDVAPAPPKGMAEMLRADSAQLRRLAALSIAPLDSSGLLAMLNGDHDQLVRLIALFLETSREALDRIDTAWARRDLVALSHIVHPLKASASTVGASPLASLCRDIETACQGGDLVGAERLLARLRPTFERVAAAVDAAGGGAG